MTDHDSPDTLKRELQTRDPADLRPHPLRNHIPKPSKNDAGFEALSLAVRDSGVREPLLIDRHNHIVKGVRRWLAAKAWQQETVPVIVVEEVEVALAFVEAFTLQRQMARGTAVYLVLPCYKNFLQAAENRRMSNLRRGKDSDETPFQSPKNANDFPKCLEDTSGLSTTYASFAERLGVSREVFCRAIMVWRLLNNPDFLAQFLKKIEAPNFTKAEVLGLQKELKAEWEPQLLNGDKSLSHIPPGIAGRFAPQDKAASDDKEQLQFDFINLHAASRAWPEMDAFTRSGQLEKFDRWFSKMPRDLLGELGARINRWLKE